MSAFSFTKYSIERHIRCSICSLPPEKQVYIPIKKWASDNNYTVKQCWSLLRKGFLIGSRYKNKYYVMENPEWQKRH